MTFFIPGTPPTVNTYWRRNRNRYFISEKGLNYAKDFGYSCPKQSFEGPVEVQIRWIRPDKRRRDVDNISKVILDCLEKSGILKDDTQVYRLILDKTPEPSKKDAGVEIEVKKIEAPQS